MFVNKYYYGGLKMDIITNTINDAADLMNYYESNAWSGARDRVSTAIEKNIFEDVCSYIWESVQDMDTITDTQLNDILWFDEVVNDMIYNDNND